MRPGTQPRGVRQKKLNPKTGQQILREDQIESADYDALQNQKHVTDGVEEGEFDEIHLQAALAGQSKGDNEGEIPAPPAEQTANFDYDSLYSLTFIQPSTYIRTSQTVEEWNGCQYDMTTEDDAYLRAYNHNKAVGARCSEDDFEKIMEVFEETAAFQSPYATSENTVLSLDTMLLAIKQKQQNEQNLLQQRVDAKAFKLAPEIYHYWKSRREESGNKALQPSLKFELHQENDDGDPYVCFRRREVRQTRKTRARDVQSTDRLKKLRKELEEGRQIVILTHQRELVKRTLLKADRDIFEKRVSVKDTKVRLGIKTDDDDLINQKPQKRRAPEFPVRPPGTVLRLPGRPDGRSFDADLVLLSEIIEGKENSLQREIEEKHHQHRKWNEHHIDLTREPLSPVQGPGQGMAFRPATAQYQYLMTPPSSVTSETFEQPSHSAQDKVSAQDKFEPYTFRSGSPPEEDSISSQPAYRRRIGRGGRLWIDRRGMQSGGRGSEDMSSDRWKFDQDDDDEQPVYERDQYDIEAMRFRSSIPLPNHLQRTRQDAALATRANGTISSNNRAAIAAPPQPQAPT